MAYQTIPLSNIDIGGPVLGLGISFDSNQSILPATYDIIKQTQENIKMLLLTTPGERTGEWISFGCDLKELLFEPNLKELKPLIADTISDALTTWISNVDLTNIDILTADDDASVTDTIYVKITYVINNSTVDSLELNVTDTGNITTG